jgi:hypothetical protein
LDFAKHPTTCGQRRIAKSSVKRESSFSNTRRTILKASLRKKVQQLLEQAGKGKTARVLTEKYEQSGALSKKDLKILLGLVEDRRRHVA